mmetsp:Transcript_42807/g.84109  ORF Transcript_42807/g.84109 Transcript_42807/m.84109 type:complete len:227 (+) Transcript_42807:363-1043(+)
MSIPSLGRSTPRNTPFPAPSMVLGARYTPQVRASSSSTTTETRSAVPVASLRGCLHSDTVRRTSAPGPSPRQCGGNIETGRPMVCRNAPSTRKGRSSNRISSRAIAAVCRTSRRSFDRNWTVYVVVDAAASVSASAMRHGHQYRWSLRRYSRRVSGASGSPAVPLPANRAPTRQEKAWCGYSAASAANTLTSRSIVDAGTRRAPPSAGGGFHVATCSLQADTHAGP